MYATKNSFIIHYMQLKPGVKNKHKIYIVASVFYIEADWFFKSKAFQIYFVSF